MFNVQNIDNQLIVCLDLRVFDLNFNHVCLQVGTTPPFEQPRHFQLDQE